VAAVRIFDRSDALDSLAKVRWLEVRVAQRHTEIPMPEGRSGGKRTTRKIRAKAIAWVK
jgi:hypothetical protein